MLGLKNQQISDRNNVKLKTHLLKIYHRVVRELDDTDYKMLINIFNCNAPLYYAGRSIGQEKAFLNWDSLRKILGFHKKVEPVTAFYMNNEEEMKAGTRRQ